MRSGASHAESRLLEIARKKLQVRRQLLNLDREQVAVVAPSPMEVSVDADGAAGIESTPPPKGNLLKVPTFRISGPTTHGSAPDQDGQVDVVAAHVTRPTSISADRQRDREELLIQMEELALDEDEVVMTLPSAVNQGDLQAEIVESQHRVRQWVNNSPASVTAQQLPDGNVLRSQVLANSTQAIGRTTATAIAPELHATVGATQTWADRFLGSMSTAGNQTMTNEQAARRIGGIPELPLLQGNRAEWVAFLISYRGTTNDYGLNNAENLERLKRALKNEPAELLRGCLIFPHQVPEAIRRLETFYGTPEKLLGEAEDILFQLPKMIDGHSHLALYSGDVTYTVAVIELAEESLRNLTLLRLLERKLHPSLGMAWAKKKNRESTLLTMKEFLDEKLQYAVAANIHVMELGDRAAKTTKTQRKQPVLMAVSKETNSLPPRHEPPKETCLMGCKIGHGLEVCPRFLSLPAAERKDKCTENRRCYRCLGVHPFGRCREKGCKLAGCGGNHHSLLHTQ